MSTIVAPTGTVVREFVNAQQVVFAVVWQGPVLPDLAAFFGDHYVAFQRAANSSGYMNVVRSIESLLELRNWIW